MFRQLLTRIVVPAAVMASLLIAEPAGAQPPLPGPPPAPPAMRPPGPPPMRAPVAAGPRPVGPPPSARPAMSPAPPSARPQADGDLYECRALCQLARRDYRAAAATLYEVLAAGPGWNWITLSSLYASAPIYTKQLRTLEQFVRGNPSDAAGHFVLVYHYLVLDARDAAVGQLREVTRLQPHDKLSAGIVQALEKAKQNTAGALAEKPTPER